MIDPAPAIIGEAPVRVEPHRLLEVGEGMDVVLPVGVHASTVCESKDVRWVKPDRLIVLGKRPLEILLDPIFVAAKAVARAAGVIEAKRFLVVTEAGGDVVIVGVRHASIPESFGFISWRYAVRLDNGGAGTHSLLEARAVPAQTPIPVGLLGDGDRATGQLTCH